MLHESLELRCDSGKHVDFRYHRCIPNSTYWSKGLDAVSSENLCLRKESSVAESNGRPPLRIALFGFGTVGSSVARILLESKPKGSN